MIPPDYNPVGDCATGYYGALCSACMPGYQRSGSYGCSECQAAYLIILRIGGIIILMGAGIGFLINYTLSSASRKNTHSVYLKIFMNHLQLLAICAQFKFNWPAQVTSFFSIGSFIMSSQESIVQFDCFMDTRNPATINRYYFKPQYHEMRVVY